MTNGHCSLLNFTPIKCKKYNFDAFLMAGQLFLKVTSVF